MPGFSSSPWSALPLALALTPIVVVPLLLLLQAGPLQGSAGSGLPQLIQALEQPERRDQQLAAAPTAGRLALWSLASLVLLPIGREGPAAQLGAAIAHALGRGRLSPNLVAAAAGAGLAGAFNTPLMGVIFVAEELTRRFQAALIWPALLMAGLAAEVAGLGGQPLFALGIHETPVQELEQALWALPIGLGAGLMGGLMARLLLLGTERLLPLARRRPILTGLALGAALALLTLISGGINGGDGETLLRQTLSQVEQASSSTPGLGSWSRWTATLAVRLIGPVLALSSGIPGGLIDPAFALGGSFGGGVLQLLGGPAWLGVLLGMAGGLAGATQLPVMSLAFAVRFAGAQQLLPGLLLASLCGAVAGRWLMPIPAYRALDRLGSHLVSQQKSSSREVLEQGNR
jgi:H+/Cl- antiporter ClcA